MSSLHRTIKDLEEVKVLLSLCKVDELVKYSRSHLWIDKEGNLADLDPTAEPDVKWNWIEQGWRYDLQGPEDKERVCKTLTLMKREDIRAQENAIERASKHLQLYSDAHEYLSMLLRFLISELLMNLIRYDRKQNEQGILSLYKVVQNDWDIFVDRLAVACTAEAGQGPEVLPHRLNNMKCVLVMYLQEARYNTEEAKKTRGKWGKVLWTLQAQEIEILRKVDLRDIVPVEEWQGALEQVLPCDIRVRL